MQAAALAGSILLSNLPEAAGGAKQMKDKGSSTKNYYVDLDWGCRITINCSIGR